jgi:heptaprenyl diphosphate synthase
LLCAILLGGTYAFSALVVKTVIGSLFAGNISMVLYSLPAGAVALTIELVLIYLTKKVSLVAVSVSGAVLNTTIQNATFCLISGFVEYFSYLPYLTLIAIPSGILIGLSVHLIIKRLPVKKLLLNDDV